MSTGIVMVFQNYEFCNMCKSECGEYCNNLGTPEKNIDMCFNSAVYRQLFESELKEWDFLLTVLKQDNSSLILKLSQLVDDNSGSEFLSRAEYFQNEFITRDEYLQDLEKEISEQVRIIKGREKLMIPFSRKHDKLRNEIYSFKKNYLTLKYEFGNYLLKEK